MDEIFNEKIDLPDIPSAPPPPTELKIRTMRSDLESMQRTGGGSPQFQNIAIPKLSLGDETPDSNPIPAHIPSITAPLGVGEESASGGSHTWLMVALIIIAVLAVGFLGYAGYHVFINSTNDTNGTPAATPGGAQTPPATSANQAAPTSTAGASPSASAPQTAGPFIHASLFKKPADQTLIFTLGGGTSGAATNAAQLQTFSQQLAALLAGAKTGTSVIEVAVQTPDKYGVSAGNLLAAMNAPVLPAQALAHFNQDATLFVYKDKNGLWPGLVLALNPGESQTSAGADVAQVESASSIANFFLTNVGAPTGGFVNGTTGANTVRVLQFVNVTPPAYFVYGWHGNDLILSASEDGYAAAAAHL